ncbi:MAG: hypothetical protein AAF316_13780 [Cyanobacteria bacterium P01_A01_bin.80]
MFDLSIVQSSTYCLLRSACGVDNQLLFSQFLEEQSEQIILKSIEVDLDGGGVYRVWRDSQLLGKFHRDIVNGLWVSQPCNYKLTPRFKRSNEAVMFIVEMNAFTTAA